MLNIDLNLLVLLNALLIECNVTKAALRANLSVSAMSRALNRLRRSLDDPLLIKSGRMMILTPYATNIKPQVAQLVHQLEQVFTVPNTLDLALLSRPFTLRASAGFAENYGAALLALMRQQAPQTTLRIISKELKHSQQLKQGDIDAEIGVISDNTDVEMKSRFLFSDHFIGVCCTDHPLTQQQITVDKLNSYQFINVQQQYPFAPQLRNDGACRLAELTQSAVMEVTGFSAAMTIASQTHLISIVPEKFTRQLRHSLFEPSLRHFQLPYAVPSLNISLLWHPKMNNDLAHRWFRECIWQACHDVNNSYHE